MYVVLRNFGRWSRGELAEPYTLQRAMILIAPWPLYTVPWPCVVAWQTTNPTRPPHPWPLHDPSVITIWTLRDHSISLYNYDIAMTSTWPLHDSTPYYHLRRDNNLHRHIRRHPSSQCYVTSRQSLLHNHMATMMMMVVIVLLMIIIIIIISGSNNNYYYY